MAYMCEDCGVIFEEVVEKRYFERNGDELCPPTYHCPECGSEFYEEAVKCCICGEHHPMREMDGDVCDDCIDKLTEKVRNLLIDGRHFTSVEVEIIKEKIELGDVFDA